MSNLRIGDVVSFTNIDKEDFIGKWSGEEYLIRAGKTKLFPDFLRSEERRVGKECRSRWSPYH